MRLDLELFGIYLTFELGHLTFPMRSIGVVSL